MLPWALALAWRGSREGPTRAEPPGAAHGCAHDLVVASHDRRLLADFRDFLVASESGSRTFSGTLGELDAELDRDHEKAERRYAQNLRRLVSQEERTLHVARRKARKKRYGRCSELDRGTPRVRLNQKREQAQVSHGRLARLREERLQALREWSLGARRALGSSLALELPVPALGPPSGDDVVVLSGVSARTSDRSLFSPLDLRLARQRLAVVGPNGAGKTTFLEILLGRRAPDGGSAARDLSRIGGVTQGGADWMLEESLAQMLGRSIGEVSEVLAAHKFPLALAERPLRSLSPGERARAALVCLFRRPGVELLVLDEPTFSLDLVGQRAVTSSLRAWPGGLVVASHDRAFLEAIGVDATLALGFQARLGGTSHSCSSLFSQ